MTPSAVRRNLEFSVGSETLGVYNADALRKEMSRFRDSLPYAVYPSVFVSWDSTPRRCENGIVLLPRSAESFAAEMQDARTYLDKRGNQLKEQVVSINAWNEWVEGDHLEPDCQLKSLYLLSLKREQMN